MWKGKYVISSVPQFPENRDWSEAQLAHHNRFREAVSYAKAILDVPEMLVVYEAEVEGKSMSPYNAAVRDYLTPPTLIEIDTSGYTGTPGEEIRVKVVDDVLVKDVEVAIIANGEVLEQGEAVRDDFNALLWIYRTQEPNEHESCIVRVAATDLPDNQTVSEVEV